ncbi:MAG: FUSC family protein [Myxococcota bacterium]
MLGQLRDALRFAPVRPALASGLRAALATVAPMVLAQALGEPGLAWTGLAGFLTALVDRGGAYWTRARAMGGFMLASVPLVLVAAPLGDHVVTAVAASFLAATLLAYARVWGAAAATVGSCALVLTLVSLAQPATLELAAARAAWCVLGSAWAMTLALVFWPIRLYRPARFAVARALRELAAYLGELGASAALPAPDDVVARLGRQRGAVRQALEDARATLAATRRGRRADSGRGELLLVLAETADRMFGLAASATELVLAVPRRGPWPAAAAATSAACGGLAAGMLEVARATERERPDRSLALPAPFAAAAGGDGVAAAEHAHVVVLLERVRGLLERARDAALGLEVDRAAESTVAEATVAESTATAARTSEPAPWATLERVLDTVRAHLTLRSAIARHALRVGVTTAVAAALAQGLQLERGYWVTLAAAATLQPQLPDTFLKVTQRVLGTMLGAVIAAALTGLVDDPRLMLGIVFVGAVISVSALPVSYALFATFLTPTFVLLAEARTHDPSLVGVRVVDTLIGGGLALLGARLLWPVSERDLFPATAAAALRTLRAELWSLARATQAEPEHRARREVGLAILNAEASLQRWLAEVRRRPSELEAQMAFVAYMRQLAAASLALGRVGDAPEALRRAIDERLGELEAAVSARVAPPPLDDALLEAVARDGDAVVASRRERVVEALRVMHGAVTRWLRGGAASADARD